MFRCSASWEEILLHVCGPLFPEGYPSPISDWRFQTHIDEVTRFEFERSGQDELAHVGLYVSFRALRVSANKSLKDI
jgi:hypothetical protein